eukprot:4824129-Heterocapsa_arctica.AAC.1
MECRTTSYHLQTEFVPQRLDTIRRWAPSQTIGPHLTQKYTPQSDSEHKCTYMYFYMEVKHTTAEHIQIFV